MVLLAVDMFNSFKSEIMNNQKRCYEDYIDIRGKVSKSSAIYKGEPVQFLYQPMFFTQDDIDRFSDLSVMMTRILEKVTDEYLKNTAFRKLFNFSEIIEELTLIDPGYKVKFPIARYDIFYHYNGDFQFCELNSDGTSSMNESRVLYKIFFRSNIANKLLGHYKFFDFELFDTWIDSILENYDEFSCTKDILPTVAITDFKGEGIESEFEVFRQRFERRGCSTYICDPREFKYKNGKLYYDGKVVDLVYRRATTARIVDEAKNIKDFLDAYRDHAVCVVGGFVSQVIHNKMLFAVLHCNDMVSFLSEEEKSFIKAHVPWTQLYEPSNTIQRKMIKENRDDLILKPCDRYAAHGVYMGKNYGRNEWESILESIKNESYVVQRICRIPRIDMVTVKDGKMYFEKYNYLTGLFMYNGNFKGIYSRAGREDIIASVAESYSLPNFIYSESK